MIAPDLTKPVRKPELKASALRAKLLKDVSPFRPVALKLMRLVAEPSPHLPRIVDLLHSDAVLTGEIMQLARSPLFGPRYEIKNVLHAVAYLGLDRINSMIVTVALRSFANAGQTPLAHRCWRHNLVTALVCQRLSQSASLLPDQCYVAGLLHDIGGLALMRAFPAYCEEVVAAVQGGRDPLAAERDLFGMDHCEVGRWLLAQWGCAIELQNVAAMHEAPPDKPLRVQAGSRMADLMGMSRLGLECRHDLASIAEPLGEATSRELLTKHPEIVDSIVMKVNEVEIGLI